MAFRYRDLSNNWVTLSAGLGEAPVDSQLYGRINSGWALIGGTGGTQTDLGNAPTSTQIAITNSGGADTTLEAANVSDAGVLASADWALIQSAVQSVNLSVTYLPLQVRIDNTAGSNALINTATGSTAGVMSTTLFNNLNQALLDSDFTVNGLMVRTSSGGYTNRTFSKGTLGGVSISNGDGVGGNPTAELDYVLSQNAPSGTPTKGKLWLRY